MSFSEDLSIIRDDDFEGSSDEIRISQEVFYGNGSTGGERGKISGFVNFGCQQHKSVESSPSLNTGAVTNVSSSQTLCLKDGTDVHGDSARNCPSASFPEAIMPEERNDPSVPAKRMKLSIDDLSSFKPFLQTALASDAPLKAIISGFDHPKSRFDSQTVMCHVVESSGGGVRSSCYLLKQGGETDQKICSLDVVRPKDYSVGSEGSEGKEIVGSNTMASPVSQESSATKTLVTNSVVTTVDDTGTRPRAVRKRKVGTPFELDNDETPWTGDCTKELRPFLRNRVFHLLADAGWIIEKRKRHCRSYEEFVYVSPLKRPVRELAKAWSVCGQILHADIYKDLEVEDGKQWTSIDHLCSDLYKTTSNMESELKDLEPKHAILRQWVLLNPFVTVVFLDRNLRSLRAGTVAVKHNADDTSDTCEKSVVVGKGKRSAGGSTIKPCSSSLASESTVIEFGTLSQGCKVDDSPSKSVYVSEGSCMRLLETDDKIEGYSGTVSVNDSRYQYSSSMPVCGSDMTSLQPAGDLYDVPVDSGNFGFRKNVTDDCLDSSSKGKRKRSRKVSEIEVAFWSEDEILNLGTPSRVEVDDQKMNSLVNKASDNKSSKKISSSTNFSKKRPAKKKSLPCQPKDDDLLVSAIVQQKKFRPSGKKYNVKAGNKVRRLKKRKNKSGCRLLPRNLGKGGKQFPEERWTLIAERTVLSWLIHTGAVLLNEFIQYRDFKGETVLKNGMITRDGIICRCCNEVFSVSGFEVHAGLKMINLGWNLFTDSGQLFTTLILEAWSAEYKARKAGLRAVQSDEFDQNDDSCGLCGDGGELLCCDKCPSTFHQSCLSAEELPEGSWYCASCTCWICGDLVDDEDSSSRYGFKCCQCEHKYHFVCLKELGVDRILSDPWFCSSSCEEVHSGLESRIGFSNLIADGFSWSVLRCIQDDQNVHSAQQLALKAECNSKLAVALTIMEECFVSMVDSRTGIDMIPQVIYNWGSEFPRLDYHGFYSVVLEKNDVLISVACIRVHGVELAEMPLVATCSKYRRKGMCRRLLTAVEQVLTSFKVEKLVVAAIPDLVETWTVGFGFVPVEEEEKKSLNKINLMVFPGTVLLKKTLNSGQPGALKLQGAGPADVHPSLGMDKSMQEGASLKDQGEHKSEKDEIYGGKDPGFMNAKLVSSHGTEILESQILSPDSDGNKCELVSFNVENESKITNPISQDGAELERKENETSSCFAIEVENKVLKPMLDEATQLADVIPSEADIKVAVEPDPQEASSPKNSSHPCSSAALEAQHESASKATLQLV